MRRARTLGFLVLALLAVGIGFGIAAVVNSKVLHSTASAHRPAARATLTHGRAGRALTAGGPGRHERPIAPAPAPAAGTLPTLVTSGTPRRRLVALTFDDGPGPYTSRVIAELARFHAPATFFVVGQQLVDFGPELHAELAHRFAVGDHTENHAWMIRLDAAGQFRQIDDAILRMHHLGAPRPTLFRPPYGAMNATTFQVVRQMGLTAILWSVDPSDWARPGTQAIIERVLSRVRPGGIVLMHDGGGDRSETVAALPTIIQRLRASGYTLVTVPRLLQLDPPPRHPHLPSFVTDR